MKWFFFLGAFLPFSLLNAQVKISGKLTDYKGNSISGASIALASTYDGTTTDSTGKFVFFTSEKGSHFLEVTMTGYDSYMKKLAIEAQPIELNISIKELITELNAVVISAGSFEASDKKKTTVLSSLDIVTTAGANADITATLKTLPGTQQIGDMEGLFVRGGTATESKIFIDGNLVNNFYYSSLPGIATRGRFNPFLFKGTVFSSGGYSALYGQALSSALVLESTDLPLKTEASLAISVIGGGGGIQKLAKNKKASWGLTYNYTNLALAFAVIKQKQDFYKIPQYHEFDANFRFKTKNGGFIKYYGYGSRNQLGFRAKDIDSSTLQNAFSLQNLNTYQNLNWRENIGNGWKSFVGLSFSTNKDDIKNELQDPNDNKVLITDPAGYALKNFMVKNRVEYAQARVVFEKRLSGLNAVRLGADHFYSDEKTIYTLFTGREFTSEVKDNLTAGFAEADFYITKDIAAKLGIRAEYSQIMKSWNAAPRISLAYKFDKTSQGSFAYGIFYQNPETKYLPSFYATLGYAKATHYILQFQRLKNQRTFRTELFYKNYNSLYKTEPNSNGLLMAANNGGRGYAKGVEIFWRDKKTIKNLDYWISYSYLDTKRDYLNFPGSRAPNFAATHTASLVLKKFSLPLKTGFNASYNFASGRPYYHLAFDPSKNKYAVKDEGKTINYNSLGFSLNYLPNLGKKESKSFIVWVLSITNVLGQKQVFGYNYASITDRKVPITPASKRFVYIGCFLSFGVDRTQDTINNNL